MAKALKTIGIVVGAVALVATGVGAFAAAGSALAATASSVAGIATVVSGVANIGARLLTKPPSARGSVTETIIEVDPPSPYLMGEGYYAGVMRHHAGYGPTLKKVRNPYLFEAVALSVGGPIQGPIIPQVDFGAVPSWYTDFLDWDTKLGAVPETALTPPFDPNAPGWSSAHRLSGVAQIGWGHKFDKDGERFASGLPTRGVLAKWVKVYDPRQDSTQPGGSGTCRLDDESTWVWAGPPGSSIPAGENPALHAGTYAYGRHHPTTGKRTFGMGLPDEGIDWEGIAAWANDCDANNWRIFGDIYEGIGTGASERWANLRDICIAGGAEPLFAGAVLGFLWNRPRVTLDTITEADLADGQQEVTAMASYRDRLNAGTPRFMQPAQNWSRLPGDRLDVATYQAEDGEDKHEEVPFNFVKDEDQAAQLIAYWVANSRELAPITLTLMPRLRGYRPGEALRLDLPQLGLDHDAVLIRRKFNPETMTVTATFVSETAAKHAFALGRTGTAPSSPAIGQSAQQRDQLASQLVNPRGAYSVRSFNPRYPVAPGDGEIVITASTAVLDDGRTISLPAHTETGLAQSTRFGVYFNLISEQYEFTTGAQPSQLSSSQFVIIGTALTSDGTSFPPPTDPPPGFYDDPDEQVP